MREFVQQEQNAGAANMNIEEAKQVTINFGAHKGKSMGQVHEEKPDYIEWIYHNTKDSVLKRAAELILNK